MCFGGVRDFMDKVQKSTYIYNANTETAERAMNMIYEAYAFPSVYAYPWIYVCGGR